MTVDFGKTAQDYAGHRAGFPPSFFERLATFAVGTSGQRVVDLGTGTGTVARALGLRGCQVTGVDLAGPLLEQAERLASGAGVSVTWHQAPAEDTGLPGAAFDVVTAGQCWHWFDRPRAGREVRRLLVPGGRLVIAHFDWLAPPGSVARATEALVDRYYSGTPMPQDRYGRGAGIYPQWLLDVAEAGFTDIETFSYDVVVPYRKDAWRGRIRASAKVGAFLEPALVQRLDGELSRMLDIDFPAEPLQVPHRVFAVLAKAPSRDAAPWARGTVQWSEPPAEVADLAAQWADPPADLAAGFADQPADLAFADQPAH